MNREKMLVCILFAINFLLVLATFWSSYGLEMLFLIPAAAGAITFVVAKKVKKFSTLRSLKYANVAFLIPLGLIVVVLTSAGSLTTRTAGVQVIDPDYMRCWNLCSNQTQELTNATQECLKKCMQNITA
jgi:hypothetical protein